jgi:hypothetical protein
MNRQDADEYCRQKSAPAGGSFYYGILFYPEPLRRELIALHALGVELEEILVKCSDPAVMRIKFAWWQDEIQRLYQQAARHPVSRALENVIDHHDIQLHQLLAIIHNIEQLAGQELPATWQHAMSPWTGGPGQIWQLSAKICTCTESETLALSGEMGGIFSLLHFLRQPVRSDEVARCSTGERKILVQDMLDTLTHYCDIFPFADRNRQLHILVMGHIVSATCKAILKNDPHPAPAPLRKLWLAWRLHRRYL